LPELTAEQSVETLQWSMISLNRPVKMAWFSGQICDRENRCVLFRKHPQPSGKRHTV